jgi:hypothetical protein
VPIDTAAESEIDGTISAYANANELVDVLVSSDEAHACYAARWLEFAYGRELGAEDAAARSELAAGRLGGLALVAKATTLAGFRQRAPNEVGP